MPRRMSREMHKEVAMVVADVMTDRVVEMMVVRMIVIDRATTERGRTIKAIIMRNKFLIRPKNSNQTRKERIHQPVERATAMVRESKETTRTRIPRRVKPKPLKRRSSTRRSMNKKWPPLSKLTLSNIAVTTNRLLTN